MVRISLRSKVGADGVLDLKVPLGAEEAQATEIFLARARLEKGCTWRPSATELYEIGRIVRATRGLPLALELAAAWEFMNKKLMPPRPLVVVGDFWRPVVATLRQGLAFDGRGDAAQLVTAAASPAECVAALRRLLGPG